MKFVRFVDKLNEHVGGIVSWLVVPLMLVVIYEVSARYLFNAPTNWSYDTLWMLYSVHFLLGGAFTLLRKGHIRIDIIYHTLSPRKRLVFDAVIYAFVVLVPSVILTWVSIGYAVDAWTTGEKLSTTNWFFPAAPIRTVMPIAFFLLALQGVAEIVRNINELSQKVEP
jgi:TRAP-type mannitol/chloroaromatic compound transport system permease small subunit